MSEQDALDKFGEFLMTKVRDEAIIHWRQIADGRMKSQRAKDMRKRISGIPESDLRILVPEVVDTVLHHLMWALEQEEDIDLAVSVTVNGEERIESLRKASDGLAGVLYTDDGWIVRFSEETGDE